MRIAGTIAVVVIACMASAAHAARSQKIDDGVTKEPEAVPGIFHYGYREIVEYNQGVDALNDEDYATAQRHFENALALNERFPEAHNNLAFSLRMQSLDNADRSLDHYNRALELAPKLAQAYLYRGILFVQLKRLDDAKKDRAALENLDTPQAQRYAKELKQTIERSTARDEEAWLGIYGAVKQR